MLLIIVGLIFYKVIATLLRKSVPLDLQFNYGHNLGNHTIFYKKDWQGDQYMHKVDMPHPIGLVIISHTNSGPCFSFRNCANTLRKIQKSHMNKGLFDIGFNFAVAGDGNIYVGRGWDVINCHVHLSIGISFIGNYNIDNINESMVEAAKNLMEQGVSLGKISKDYELIGHNQSCKIFRDSPGENVYKEIKTWYHFKNMVIYNNNNSEMIKPEDNYMRRFRICDHS